MPRKPTTEGAMEMVYELMAAASAKSTPLKATWNECVGAGRAHEGLRANWLEQLKLAVDTCGFRYIRFHGLLHDEMFVYKEVNGQPVYNWQYIDELFDRLLDAGIRPFVELGFMPNDLASAEGYQFWWKGNVTPPKSDEKWQGLIDAMIRHWISRYGVDEVLTWYFEVWNEPNLNGFWKGTRSEYFHLYKITVQAIKAIHPYLRVGGRRPATLCRMTGLIVSGKTEAAIRPSPARISMKQIGVRYGWRLFWISVKLRDCQWISYVPILIRQTGRWMVQVQAAITAGL